MPDQGIAVAWAERVSRHDPHALVHVEDVLLTNLPRNRKRLRHGLKGGFRAVAWLTVFALLAVSPLAAPVVFSSGRWWGTTREYDAGWAYPAAATVSWIGVLVLAIYYAQWRRQRPVRLRDSNGTKFAVMYVVSTLLALWFAHSASETFDGSIGWYVLPLWILLPLSVLSVVYQVRSPANPVSENRLDVSRIHREDQAWLLEERDQALRVLANRGLLEGASPDELAARPLGELHLSREESHDVH